MADAAPVEPILSCGNCRGTMQRLALPSHYGATVALDLCTACNLVWFDDTESARLSGPALLELIGQMALAQALPIELLKADPRCPRCDGRLELVHNESRWGRSTQLQCRRRHGAYQSFAQFLQEKGLLRPMSKVDRARLLRDRGQVSCVNCGGDIQVDDAVCPFCGSVPSLLDIARLAHALDPQDTIGPQRVFATPARQSALQCAACGVALPPGETVSCSQCGATLAITKLAEAHACVQALAPALKAAAEKPSPEVVKRRLEVLDADLPRRREWVARMAAESRHKQEADDEFEWPEWWLRLPVAARIAIAGVAIGLLWRYAR